jgi:hypothetical protein
LELLKIMIYWGENTRHWSASLRCYERKSLDPRKDHFLKLMMQSSWYFKRDARLE